MYPEQKQSEKSDNDMEEKPLVSIDQRKEGQALTGTENGQEEDCEEKSRTADNGWLSQIIVDLDGPKPNQYIKNRSGDNVVPCFSHDRYPKPGLHSTGRRESPPSLRHPGDMR